MVSFDSDSRRDPAASFVEGYVVGAAFAALIVLNLLLCDASRRGELVSGDIGRCLELGSIGFHFLKYLGSIPGAQGL